MRYDLDVFIRYIFNLSILAFTEAQYIAGKTIYLYINKQNLRSLLAAIRLNITCFGSSFLDVTGFEKNIIIKAYDLIISVIYIIFVAR